MTSGFAFILPESQYLNNKTETAKEKEEDELKISIDKEKYMEIIDFSEMDNVTELNLWDSYTLSDIDLINIKYMSKLEILDLSQTLIGTETINMISNLITLKKLDLYNTKIINSDLELISNLINLEVLDLENVNVDDFGLKNLSNMNYLHCLNLRNTSIYNIECICKLNNLVDLNLEGTKITDSQNSLAEITNLKKLKRLNLAYTRIGNNLRYLSELKNLEILNLSGTDVNDTNLSYINILNKLIRLVLSDNKITDNGILTLSYKCILSVNKENKCELEVINERFGSNLQDLDLKDTEITESILEYFNIFPSLNTIDISNTNVTYETLESYLTSFKKEIQYDSDHEINSIILEKSKLEL